MPYNPAIAATVNSAGPNLPQALGSIAQFNSANAMAGLRDVQALQAQRQYNALQAAADAYRNQRDPVGAYLAQGGDPAGAGQLQNVFAGQRAMSQTPGGILPNQALDLGKLNKTNAETQGVNLGLQAKLAGGVMADPTSDDAWTTAVNAHYKTFGGPDLERQQLLAIKDPNQRLQIARAYSGQGVDPNEANKPFQYEPGNNVTTPGRLMSAGIPLPQAKPGQPGQPAQPAQPGQPNAAPLPAPQTINPAPAIQGLTPQQKSLQTATGTKTVDYLQDEGYKSYSNAQTLLGSMVNVDHDIDKLGPNWMGPGADMKASAVKIINSVRSQAGLDPISGDKVATWEEFNKEQTRAGMQLINSNFGGSREAASIIQMGRAATPGVSNSYLGAKYVSATIKAAAQRQVDLYEYQAQHPEQLPAVSAVQFNKMNPPQQYAMQGIASVIPDGAKQTLMQHPETAATFNKHFGSGMAQFILGTAGK